MRISATLVLSILVTASGYAQESHIEKKYYKEDNTTVVHSDLLYVVNTPSQFMQIQLVARVPGKDAPTGPPERLFMSFSSFAPQAVYQLDAKHRLHVKADDRIIDFGLLSYSNVYEKGKPEKEKSNPKPLPSNFDFLASLPPTAQVNAVRAKTPLTVEMMSISELHGVELRAMANANDVIMRVGDTVFRLTPMQRSILHEFAEAVVPKTVDLSATSNSNETSGDVPSDMNKAPLADTLKFLKTQIDREQSSSDPVLSRKVETMSFETCRISFRIVPLVRNSPVSQNLVYAVMEYEFDLKDLNPEAVEVTKSGDSVMVMMTARDYQPKLKIFKHANDRGTMGRTLEEGLTETAILKFKTRKAAVQFKTALAHAINLCQGNQ